MKNDPGFADAFGNDEQASARFDRTAEITQDLERDIINFLSGKYTENATLTVVEIVKFYDCSVDQAKRVIESLVSQRVLAGTGIDAYKVLV